MYINISSRFYKINTIRDFYTTTIFKNFDEIDSHGFGRFAKRNFDEIDSHGFGRFAKRNFDEIDRAGFGRFV